MSKKKKTKTIHIDTRPLSLSADRDETSEIGTRTTTAPIVVGRKDIHPRVAIVEAAEADLRSCLTEHRARHDLTPAERIRVLSFELGDQIQDETKRAIRIERHGDASRPGDRKW